MRLFVHAAGKRLLALAVVGGYGFIETVAACKIVAGKPALGQDAAGQIAAQAALAHDIHGFGGVQFCQVLPQLVQRQVDKTVRMAPAV